MIPKSVVIVEKNGNEGLLSISCTRVSFGYQSYGEAEYNLNQTYADFVSQQAAQLGIPLQPDYLPIYKINQHTSFAVDSTLTFAELHDKYGVPFEISVPDPEKPVDELG